MKILITIGLDSLGKTPLTELLVSEASTIGWTASRRQVLKNPKKLDPGAPIELAHREIDTWQPMLINDDEEAPDLLVYDRFPWPDDYVYSHLTYGDEMPASVTAAHEKLHERMRLLRAVVYYLYLYPPDWTSYMTRMTLQPDEIVDTSRLEGISVAYENWLERYAKPGELAVREEAARYFRPLDARAILEWLDPH